MRPGGAGMRPWLPGMRPEGAGMHLGCLYHPVPALHIFSQDDLLKTGRFEQIYGSGSQVFVNFNKNISSRQ